ncbi:hypothetical protein IC757_08300 [Wenzhouxiangella sp. AB-CW3]|uniref:hypothetical protein n=1 Tax=Wenzhouxiangella sp. AB-CW3 TaxID=2771012 RepID=UPI00168AAF67|nr:hypothetical protein [Wenzhouxiangella sp. AB-CW3]QOC24088.1 hypothetical protein IC757_08300 [Wenzhouxiangella sp. AB-CW3]
MSQLTAVYLKLDLEIPVFDQEPSRNYLQDLVGQFASAIYRQDTDVDVQFRQGSLEVMVVIVGSLYVAIGNYGSFRSGLNQVIEDSKVLKDLLISSLRKDGIAGSAILEQKRHNATPERVRRLLRRIDRFERQLPKLGEDEAKYRLERLLKAVQQLTAEMEFSEDIDLLMTNLDERFRPPPEAIPMPRRKVLDSEVRPTFLEPKRDEYSFPSHTKLPPPD